MRDVLLLGVICVVLPHAVRKTWVAVLLWTWLSLMNPHKLSWGFSNELPLAAIAAGTAFISLLFNLRQLRFPPDASVRMLIAFLLWCCVTTLVALYPAESGVQLWKVIKIQLMTLVAMVAIRERRHIELLVWVSALSIGFYGLKGGIFTLMGGGSNRVWGPPGGFIEGNNEIGLALIMIIPLLNYLRLVEARKWVRWGLASLMLLCAVSALGTQSRGAFLAIAAMAVVLWWRSPNKAAFGVAVVVASVLLVAFMPSTWEERMQSIRTYEQDASAMGRINAWWTTFNVANDRFFGGGFELYQPSVFQRYAPNPEAIHAAHSIYFQVLGEHGWVGLILFLSLGWLTWRDCQRLRVQSRHDAKSHERGWVFHLSSMIQVSMVGYAVGGAFLSLAYFDLPYNMMVVVVALRGWMHGMRPSVEHPSSLAAAPKIKPV